MTSIEKTNGRNTTFDLMKGVGIICVIIGHSTLTPEYLVKFIYSWHMPLFFLLSGCFFKEAGTFTQTKKDFRGLIFPYIFAVLIFAIAALLEQLLINGNHLRHIVWGGIFGTPRALYDAGSIYGKGYIGALWFIPSLFVCRCLYRLLCRLPVSVNLLIGGGYRF